MKVQVRRGVFETNSSSTHSITICSKEEFERWKNGDLIFDRYDDKLCELSEIPDEDSEDYDECQYETYGQWYEDEYLELFEEEYTSKNGDEIVAFGKYGYD